jgi:peptidoglycan/xylan/chitin deacetylase (PgdA/CDA1 family)
MNQSGEQAGTGTLIVSLDFELHWGIFDKYPLESRKKYFIKTRDIAIPGIISLFKEFNVHATWASVGILFCQNREEFNALKPILLPNYSNSSLSAYKYIDSFGIGKSEADDPFHFAASLLKILRETEGQEIGSHTFSHYYCLEDGQNTEAFAADLDAAIEAAKTLGISLKSLVFPRNQYNEAYLQVCIEKGIKCIRGNENSWVWNASKSKDHGLGKRAFRLLDSYLNIYGRNGYPLPKPEKNDLVNIPSSRFLRPYFPPLAWAEAIKVKRICRDIDNAAKNNLCYHLWWHPHNFGFNTEKNLSNLRTILQCFNAAQQKYGMKSMNMAEVSGIVNKM